MNKSGWSLVNQIAKENIILLFYLCYLIIVGLSGGTESMLLF